MDRFEGVSQYAFLFRVVLVKYVAKDEVNLNGVPVIRFLMTRCTGW